MAENKEPLFSGQISVNPCVQFVNADSTTSKTLFTAGADGASVNQLTATTDDTSSVDVVLSLNNGTTTNIIGQITVGAGAGTSSIAAVDLLDSNEIRLLQNDGSILLGPNCSIEMNCGAAVTAAKTLYVTASCTSYTAA